MHSFKDSDGREWSLRITIGAVDRVKGEFEGAVDLLRLAEGEPSLASRLDGDPALLCHVIYALVKRQEPILEAEEFCERIDAAAFAGAEKAFWDEISDFFRTLGRTDLVRLIEAQKQVKTEVINRNRRQAELNLQTALAAIPEAASPRPIPGELSGAFPEFAESTLAP